VYESTSIMWSFTRPGQSRKGTGGAGRTGLCGDAIVGAATFGAEARADARRSVSALGRPSPGEAGVSQSCADRQHAPALGLSEVRQLAQSLHDRVVVHDHHGLMIADAGDMGADSGRQVEAAALPVARQVLGPAADCAILLDPSRAADADHRGQ